ncbi:hypothetical protein MHYP_G00132480 [Metynnis hypsauchen]
MRTPWPFVFHPFSRLATTLSANPRSGGRGLPEYEWGKKDEAVKVSGERERERESRLPRHISSAVLSDRLEQFRLKRCALMDVWITEGFVTCEDHQ